MKVILLQDVAKIGSRAEVVEVPDGYAMNQLIPKRMAEPATAGNLKRAQQQSKHKTASKEAAAESFETALSTIEATPITVTVEANEQGHLFRAVSAAEVVTAAQAIGASITEEMVHFAEPIKTIGEHSVKLVHGGNEADITINVAGKEA